MGVLAGLSAAIRSRALAISTPPAVTTAAEYLARREHDTAVLAARHPQSDTLFLSEVPREDAFLIAHGLDDLGAPTPRVSNVESLFAKSFSDDLVALNIEESIRSRIQRELPTRYIDVARRRAEGLLLQLGTVRHIGHFSRATVEACARNAFASPELLDTVNERSTTLFHAANAVAMGAALFTERRFAKDVPLGIDFAHPGSFSPMNPYLFLQVMQRFGIDRRSFAAFRADEWIHGIGAAPEFREFVREYRRLIDAYGGRPRHGGSATLAIDHLLADIDSLRGSGRAAQRLLQTFDRDRTDWFVGALGAVVALMKLPSMNPVSVGRAAGGASKMARGWLRGHFERGVIVMANFERWLDDSEFRAQP